MLDASLFADLVTELPAAVRLQRLVTTLRSHFACGAVALLQLQQAQLKPIAVQGLLRETLGRRFEISQHPRLAAILASRQPVRFPPGSDLPDPYDGLLAEQPGEALPVHDCMGMTLYVDGQCWGAITLDALSPACFDALDVLQLQQLSLLIEATIRLTELERINRALRQREPESVTNQVADGSGQFEIIGQSPTLLRVLQELDVVAASDLPVLLLGETGVGKELFARRLHRKSTRSTKPMVYVNCAALPESLAESELFGHCKGAFSGALSERAGRFDAADGGTLFLDEVGELPLSVQAKLLRVLQNGEIQRLGSDHLKRVNVRLVAATNRDLQQQVKLGEFRADLYHRLSVYPIMIPPLRERTEDLSLLAGHFLELNRSRLGLRSIRLSSPAEIMLLHYGWPGNVRELEHVLSRAAIKALSLGAQRTDIVTLQPELLDLPSEMPQPLPDNSKQSKPVYNFKLATQQWQKQFIEQALAQHANCWAKAARALELDASNLHKLAQRLGIK